MLYLVGDPKTRGMVFSVQNVGNTVKYEVFVDGGLRIFYTGQIAPVVEKVNYNWVDINTFQSYLSAYEINNPSAGNLYSLNSARINTQDITITARTRSVLQVTNVHSGSILNRQR